MQKKAIVRVQKPSAVVGAAPDRAGRAGEKGEIVSPLRATELPPDFDFIASKTADEKVEYIRAALARSEDEAVAVIAPALQFYGTATFVVEAYLPLILEVKRHFCRPGRPRTDPATGSRSRTWEEICEEHFRIGIRRMQQILASLRQPKLTGAVSGASRKPPIDRAEFERARRVAAPAATLAEAVVKQGLGDRFPEALEILRLAGIPVPAARPASPSADAGNGPNWKGVLTGVVAVLERHRDGLPAQVVEALEGARLLLDCKADPQAAAAPVAAGTARNERAPADDAKSPSPSPVAESVAEAPGGTPPGTTGAALGELPVSPGDWITFDPTCKYVGRFIGRKGKSKRFVVMTWRRKPAYGNPTGWYQTLVDGTGRRLSEEEVREKFPRAWQEWQLLHPEGAPGAACRPGSNTQGGSTDLSTAGPAAGPAPAASPAEPAADASAARAGEGPVPCAAAPPDGPSGQGSGSAPAPRPPRSVASFRDRERGTVKPGYLCKHNGGDCEITKVWDDGTVSLLRASGGAAVSANPVPVRELRCVRAAEAS